MYFETFLYIKITIKIIKIKPKSFSFPFSFKTKFTKMKCHKLMYKPYRKTPPYEDYLRKQKEKQQKKKKQFFYEEIIKFRESRYPLDFLKILQEKINPFELSLQKLKEVFSQRHPQYSNELVNESVEHIFNRKCQESEMIKESAIVIQYGDEYIRNGRKLIKEDFSFDFSNFIGNPDSSKIHGGGSTSRGKTVSNNGQNLTKRSTMSNDKFKFNDKQNRDQNRGGMTERNTNGPLSSDRLLTNKSRADSPSKIVDLMKRTERFNEILLNQIKKDKQRFQNLQQIQQGSPNDSIFYNYQQQHQGYTDRSKFNDSLNTFREEDLLVRPDSLDTGRSEVEELNFILSSLNFQEGGQETRRSKRSQNTLRINRQVKEQLYNARGGLKLEIVRRAIEQLKRESNIGSSNISRIMGRG